MYKGRRSGERRVSVQVEVMRWKVASSMKCGASLPAPSSPSGSEGSEGSGSVGKGFG